MFILIQTDRLSDSSVIKTKHITLFLIQRLAWNRMEMLNSGQPLPSLSEMHRLAVMEQNTIPHFVRKPTGKISHKYHFLHLFQCYYFKKIQEVYVYVREKCVILMFRRCIIRNRMKKSSLQLSVTESSYRLHKNKVQK